VFGVTKGKLPSFLVSYRGIEANPEKIRTIEAMRPPAHIKDVQKLMGCLVVLSRFISILLSGLSCSLSFCTSLDLSCGLMRQKKFQELKRYLTSPMVMVAPEPGEPLLLYVVVTAKVVSMVLVTKWPEPP
jgi:hypothetical protein